MASKLTQLSNQLSGLNDAPPALLGVNAAQSALDQTNQGWGDAKTYGNPETTFYGVGSPSTLGNIGAGMSGSGIPVIGGIGGIISGINTMTDPLKLNFGATGQQPTASGLYSGVQEQTGQPAVGYNQQFGGIPGVPSVSGSQEQSISGNLGNLGGIYDLASGVQGTNASTAAQALNANLPGYQGMANQSSADILSNLQGDVSQGTINQLEQVNAERGIGAGMGVTDQNAPAGYGSNQNAALDQALGQTSEQLQQQGLQELGGAISETPTGAQFDASSFLTSPDTQQSTDYLANELAAAPIPSESANFSLQELLDELAATGGGGSSGGGGGGLGGLIGGAGSILNGIF